MVASVLLIFFTLISSPGLRAAETSATRSVCQADEKQRAKVEKCQRELRSPDCEDFPKDQLRDCFDPSQDYQNPVQENFTCVKGTWEGIKDTVKGVAQIASKAYQSASDHSAYQKKVRAESYEACEKDKEVIKARENYRQIVQNIGMDLAAMKYLPEMNAKYSQCIDREQRKGTNLGVSFQLPSSGEVKALFVCLNSKAQTEMVCKVVGPMVVGGVAGAGVKAAAQAALRKAGLSAAGKVEMSYGRYMSEVKGQLAPKEIESLKHQKDLLAAIKNPEIAERIEAAGVDLDALTKGILDSDFGKLESGQKLLMQSSPESDRLLNILRGKDSTTAAGRAYQKHMSEIGQAGKTDFNAEMNNDQIRQIIRDRPILAGELHELPGMSRAIKDFDSGAISERQFIDRLNANRGHNHSPEGSGRTVGASGNQVIPFWDDLENIFIPGALKGDPLRAKFFANTVYDSGRVTEAGVVIPRYPAPTQKSVFIHSVFDRLSQGTGGGNIKMFYETSGKILADNPNIPIGELPDLTNFGAKNGLNNLANQLTGTAIKKADGSVVQTFSNAERTNVQFRGLQQAIAKSPYTESEKSALSELTRAGRDRNLAFDEFAKNQISYVKDSNGNILKMSLKDVDGNYIGTISRDTPTNQALDLIRKFQVSEEKLNGEPFKDLMNPRFLSKSEVAAYGFPASLGYYYCDKTKNQKSLGEKILGPRGTQ